MQATNRYLILAGLVVFLSLVGCGKQQNETPATVKEATPVKEQVNAEKNDKPAKESATEPLKLSEAEIATAGIKVASVTEESVKDSIQLTATIQPNRDRLAHVAPRVAGRITRVGANLGQQVKQGQALAQLDSIELGEAHSAFLQAQSEAKLAEANFSRIEGLYNEQIVTQKDYLNARAESEKTKTAVRAARDKLRMLGISPSESASAAVSAFPLTAPFSGTIIEKDAVLGELAQPDKSLFTIADLSVVWIEADLYEKDLGKVSIGAESLVTVSAYPEKVFKGRLAYISNALDKESRTVKARIEVNNAEGLLKPEMFANAALATSSSTKALVVPTEAVVLMQGIQSVFIRKGDVFEPRSVEFGEKLTNGIIVRSGINSGESVVVSGAYALKARALKSQIGEAD